MPRVTTGLPCIFHASSCIFRIGTHLGMLLHQAVPGFEAWFGPRPAVTPALRDRIVADLAG